MTQDGTKDRKQGTIDKAPTANPDLIRQRDNPGLEAGGTGAVGAARPAPGARTADTDVGARHVGNRNSGHLTTMPDLEQTNPAKR